MSMTLLAALATLSVGVDVGWQPAQDGGLEYIIQIEPHKLKTLQNGDTISVGIRPELRNVRCYRIVVGNEDLPRNDETLQQSLKTPGSNTATPEIAGPYCPVDERDSDAIQRVAGSGDALRQEKSIWNSGQASDTSPDASASQPPTLTLSPPATNQKDRWERTESMNRRPDASSSLGDSRAVIGRADNNWAQADAGATRQDMTGVRPAIDPPLTSQIQRQPDAVMPRTMADNSTRLVPLDNNQPVAQPQPGIRPDNGRSAVTSPQTRGRYGDVLSGPAAENQPRSTGSRDDWPTAEFDRQPVGATSPQIAAPRATSPPMMSPTMGPSTAGVGNPPQNATVPGTRYLGAVNRGPRLTPTAPDGLQAASPPARRPVQFSADPSVVPAVGQTRTPPALPNSRRAGNAVVSSAAPPALPASDTNLSRSTDESAAKAKTSDSTETEARPWLPLTVCLAALFASLGGNLYLGWMTLDIRRRFQHLAYRARKSADTNPLEESGRRGGESRSYT